MATTDHTKLPDRADVVIVGAGVAGLYCAWRLLTEKDPAPSVVVLERLNRTGGRLDSDLIHFPGGSVVREEEGGMRFNYEMEELMAVCKALDLCDQFVPFPMSGGGRYNFRGVPFTMERAADHPAIWGELYNLAPDELNKSPVELVTEAYDRLLEGCGLPAPEHPQPEFWQDFRLDCKWNGVPLNEWTLWGLLHDMGYSEQAVVLMSHALGFEGPFLSLANAGEAFQILEDFPSSPHYFTFEDGFSTLPNALVSKVEADAQRIFLSTNVDAVEALDGGGFRLGLTVAPEGESSSPWVPDGVGASIDAGQVILAVASASLERLFHTSPPLNGGAQAHRLWDDLASVQNMRLMKINLYFDRPWWKHADPPIVAGPSFTDLPINSLYPFYALENPDDSPAALTIYCDFNNTNYWQGLQNVGTMFDSPLQREKSKPPQVIFPASNEVVKEARRQMGLLYRVDDVPEPILTSYRLWDGHSDFGYAYHQWGLGADDRGVIQRLVQPVEGVYTCNEAYSDMQGWVNGSLRSADLVLSEFGVAAMEGPGCQQAS